MKDYYFRENKCIFKRLDPTMYAKIWQTELNHNEHK